MFSSSKSLWNTLYVIQFEWLICWYWSLDYDCLLGSSKYGSPPIERINHSLKASIIIITTSSTFIHLHKACLIFLNHLCEMIPILHHLTVATSSALKYYMIILNINYHLLTLFSIVTNEFSWWELFSRYRFILNVLHNVSSWFRSSNEFLTNKPWFFSFSRPCWLGDWTQL